MLLFYLGSSVNSNFSLRESSMTILEDFSALLTSSACCFVSSFISKASYKPSSTDSGTTGDAVFDYFWGMELYPRVLGWDVKMFTNCRFGMMAWGLIIISFACKQSQLMEFPMRCWSQSPSTSLYRQVFLVGTGYLRSMDIMYDRAGFCICWGCMVWVPAVYTSPTLFLVNHPNHLGNSDIDGDPHRGNNVHLHQLSG